MTTQRERFEAFAKDQGWSVKRWKENGKRARAYQHVTVRAAWLAWQEAERQAIERCAKACEAMAEDMEGDDNFLKERAALQSAAAELQATGAEDEQ